MDAGALRYFSGHPVLDLGMLNDHVLLFHPGSGSSKQALEKKLSLLLPPYFNLFPRWNPVLIDSLGLIPLAKVENPDYSVLRNRDQSTLVLYLAPWAQNE